jgi:hypothetical protein
MIENESGYLITYFRRIYQALRGQSSQYPAAKIAQELGDTIPVTMQNELVYEIAGEFCETLCRLLNESSLKAVIPFLRYVSSLQTGIFNFHSFSPKRMLQRL